MFLYAQGAAPAQQGSMIGALLPMVIIFVIFYFLIIRPQKKKQKEHQAKISTLQKGEKVVTVGGIYGTIVRVLEDRFELKVSDNSNIFIAKSGIATVVQVEKEQK